MSLDEQSENFPPLHEMRLNGTYEEIQQLYLSDNRPWIVGYSGGKDSTAALQFVWTAISKLPKKNRKKTVYVITSDTLVENPIVLTRIHKSIDNMRDAAKKQKLPFQIEIVQPEVTQSFWVNLIGRGYASPTRLFRWCTDRLKIRPSSKFIEEKIAYHGEVIIILGVRKGESATRDQVLSLRKTKRMYLYSHATFTGAYVYAPVRDFSVEDVWGYLLQQESPWKDDNYQLLSMYRNAQDGECPLVVDKSTPSCGNTRFGCWVCTLVSSDRSMENLIDAGEDWMDDLLEIRDYLYETTIPAKKHIYRDYKRRNGRVSFKTHDPSTIARGPYYFKVSKKILKDVLTTQRNLIENGGQFRTITEPELHEIRRIWRIERNDWQDSLPTIYKEIFGKDLDWKKEDIVTFKTSDESTLEKICIEHEVPLGLAKKLIDLEAVSQGLSRRTSIIKSIDRVFSEEWRSEEEILGAIREGI